jgi:hypothetical protein
LTAGEASSSPSVIHGNYKGLATKKEAEKWFAVARERPGTVIQFQETPSKAVDPT